MSISLRPPLKAFSPPRLSHRALSAIWAIVGALLASPLRAEIGVMDWEGGTNCTSSISASGLLFTNARGTICSSNGTGANSLSNGSIFANDITGLRVIHQHGLPFTPVQIEVGEYSRTLKAAYVGFVGYKADGAVVTVQAPLDGIADGPGGAPDFQNFVFPASFENIVRLEVPSGSWSFDNLFFSTVIPPPLPTDQRLGANYRSIKSIYSKSIHSPQLVVGPDYVLNSGFSAPQNTKFVLPGNTRLVEGTRSPHYSRETSTLYYANSASTALFSHVNGVTSTVATPADTSATGWPMQALDLPRRIGATIVFMGYTKSGLDQFALFAKTAGVTRAVITPQTSLPGPTGTPLSTPFWFPNDIAVNATGFAFDTSLASQTGVHRLYSASLEGAVRYVVGENDVIPTAGGTTTVTDLKTYAFNATGELEVNVTLNTGDARLVFDSVGLRQVIPTARTVAPVNAGKTVSGMLFPANPALFTVPSPGELFRESEGRFFRVLGVGDKIGTETLSYLELKTVPSSPPARVIIEVRYASSSTMAHLLEVELGDPILHPPRLGAPQVHPESGDWFVPLSHTTAGKARWLARSNDLKTWERLWTLPVTSPLQHVFIPRSQTLAPTMFFRVEED